MQNVSFDHMTFDHLTFDLMCHWASEVTSHIFPKPLSSLLFGISGEFRSLWVNFSCHTFHLSLQVYMELLRYPLYGLRKTLELNEFLLGKF